MLFTRLVDEYNKAETYIQKRVIFQSIFDRFVSLGYSFSQGHNPDFAFIKLLTGTDKIKMPIISFDYDDGNDDDCEEFDRDFDILLMEKWNPERLILNGVLFSIQKDRTLNVDMYKRFYKYYKKNQIRIERYTGPAEIEYDRSDRKIILYKWYTNKGDVSRPMNKWMKENNIQRPLSKDDQVKFALRFG